MNRRQTAAILNIRTSQGLADRLEADRRKLQRLTGPDRHIVQKELHSGADDQAERQWLRWHHTDVRSVVNVLLAHRPLVSDEAAEWLVELARDNDQPPDRAFIAMLRIAAVEVSESPQVKRLPSDHPLQVELDRWAQLAVQHRQVSARGEPGSRTGTYGAA